MDKVNNRTIKIYNKDEKEFFNEWIENFENLEVKTRILRKIEKLRYEDFKDYNGIGDGLYEMRFSYDADWVLYFAIRVNNVVILLCAGPIEQKSELIASAKVYLADYKKHEKKRFFRDFDDLLIEKLMDEKEVPYHLEVVLEEFVESNDKTAFLRTLRAIAVVQGGIAELSERTHINRQSLHKALCPSSNPKLDIIGSIVKGLGFKIKFVADHSV